MEVQFIPYIATTTLPHGKVLILAPHPDDEVFGCAGAIMQHIAQGDSVTVIIVTDGRAATSHKDFSSQLSYIEQRRQESRHAATLLGYGEPEFWEIPDRTLELDETLIQRLFIYITEKQITQVYAPAVTEIHPDHYALAQIAIETVTRCSQTMDLILYEIAIPLHPNRLLDITPMLERKQQVMACFTSQLAIRDYSRHLQCLNGYRSYTLPSTVKAAEAYYVIKSELLRSHPLKIFGQTRQTALLEEAYQRVNQLAEELSRVYKSRSWWLTKPLRWLNQFIYSLFKKGE